MIFLPQFLYMVKNVPVFLTKPFFQKLDSTDSFYGDYKAHRISKQHLYNPKIQSWLTLPNISLLDYEPEGSDVMERFGYDWGELASVGKEGMSPIFH